jgi:hypothetical protein
MFPSQTGGVSSKQLHLVDSVKQLMLKVIVLLEVYQLLLENVVISLAGTHYNSTCS